MTMDAFDWKDGELSYCRTLVRTRGNSDVPRDSVRSYLDVQIASARRDKRDDVVTALVLLVDAFDHGEWKKEDQND